MLKNVKLILFDLGRVLIDFDFVIAIKKLRKLCDLDMQKVKSLFQDSDLAESWDRGTISEDKFFSTVQEELNLPLTMEVFRSIWNDIFSEKREMIDFALSLKDNSRGYPWIRNGHKMFILSNTNLWHVDHLRKIYPWLKEFDGIIASCDVKLLKPEEEIFKLALESAKVRPSETLYIDDVQENVAAAKRMGIHAYRFQGYVELVNELTNHELSVIKRAV